MTEIGFILTDVLTLEIDKPYAELTDEDFADLRSRALDLLYEVLQMDDNDDCFGIRFFENPDDGHLVTEAEIPESD